MSVNETDLGDPTSRVFNVIIAVYLPLVIALTGLVGNTVILSVLRTYTRKSSATFLLKILAFTDFSFLLAYIPTEWVITLYRNGVVKVESELDHYVLLVLDCLSSVKRYFEFETAWIIVVLTIDRFLQIKYPMNQLRWNTLRRARVAVVTIYLLGLPATAIRYYYMHQTLLRMNDTLIIHIAIRYDVNQLFVFDLSAFCLVPISIIVPFTIANVVILKSRLEQRQRLSGTSMNQVVDKSTKMTIIVVILFVVMKLPTALDVFLQIFSDHEQGFDLGYRQWTWPIARALALTNASVNILVYFLVGSEFRKRYRRWYRDVTGASDRERADKSITMISSFHPELTPAIRDG